MNREEQKKISLSWLVISTRDYKREYDWYLDKEDLSCHGIPNGNYPWDDRNNEFEYYEERIQENICSDKRVLMPELQNFDIETAAEYLRQWCSENQIGYLEDLDQYKSIEAAYWGLEKNTEFDSVVMRMSLH